MKLLVNTKIVFIHLQMYDLLYNKLLSKKIYHELTDKMFSEKYNFNNFYEAHYDYLKKNIIIN